MDNKQVTCEQEFPLFISHSASDCEVLKLQLIRTVPKTCAQSILELKETLWIPLKDNSWIYVATATTRMTVLCSDQNPTDIEIGGSGILTFLADCTGYGDKAMIRSLTSRYVNHMKKDIMLPLYLPFNCCETSENRIHLDELQLETPLKNILTMMNCSWLATRSRKCKNLLRSRNGN
jgi:hypothetical protein